eukprot:CAMPEP_0118941666 /NCGR_PEP_ID=MMETSP1169-20130426/34393_1 /TAXON_ID=36882 /ORGANISM="Pyramimonas obovata, Strain CCMP722" /LENGTH=267 /DNA_ID=CAMNT_0006886485 /DNA_START=84 /DNA_END=884 /DNA_ORIENTATION=+
MGGEFHIFPEVSFTNPTLETLQSVLRIATFVAAALATFYYKLSFIRFYAVTASYSIDGNTALVLQSQILQRQEHQSGRGICVNGLYGRYSYMESADNMINITGCAAPRFEEIIRRVGEDTILVPTVLKNTRTRSIPVYDNTTVVTSDTCTEAHGQSCHDAGFGRDVEFSLSGTDLTAHGSCECSASDAFLQIGTEQVQIQVDHVASMTKRGSVYRFVNLKSHISIYGIKGKQKKFKEGETVSFTVKEALDWMGLDLDKTIDQQPNRK